MDKFDLLCKRHSALTGSMKGKQMSYYVPACIQPAHADAIQLYNTSGHDVTFYYDFHGFLPEGLFHRVTTRCIRWSLEAGGHEPQLLHRQGRFFLDMQHDFVIHMEHPTLARVKVVVLRVVSSDTDTDSTWSEQDSHKRRPSSAPAPSACAKLRHFLECTLSEVRETWMKRISYEACVCCYCERPCEQHNMQRCSHPHCLHFLNLDDCITNQIVCCSHRRVKTAPYRRWFPAPQERKGPVILDDVITGSLASESVPLWMKSAAKLLSGGGDDGAHDWVALAKALGYKQRKLDEFSEDSNPALALITDWVLSSGNTTLSVDMLTSFLEQLQRDDVVSVIQRGQEEEMTPAQVFISYQWEQQDEVSLLRERLERAGYTCWMDIGQMGGGDQLYAKIDEGMRHAKVVVACVSPKYCVSHYCNRELHLADLLRKPIIPVLFDSVPWPPPGAMALIFSQLVYVSMKGVGGHGGAGIHADTEDKYQSIIQRLSAHCTPQSPPQIELPPLIESSPVAPSHEDSDSSFASMNSDDGDIPSLHNRSHNLLTYSQATSRDTRMTSRGVMQSDGVWRRNTSARHSTVSPGQEVEQVNVTNCAVCVIL